MKRPLRRLAAWIALFLVFPAAPMAAAQRPIADDAPAAKPSEAGEGTASARTSQRDRPGYYMGRRIADVMSWRGAEWLYRQTRIEEEQPEAMLDALEIAPGSTVADVGAGVGYHSLRLSKRVGPEGRVLATDIQPQMIRMLKQNARAAGVRNVEAVLSTQRDAKLPAEAVDLILMVDVYHECSDPEAVLDNLFQALRPGGRLVLVEFRGEDPEVPIKPEHKMTIAQVRREVEPRGFAFQKTLDFLPWQHIIIFEKPKPTQEAEAVVDDQAQTGGPSPATP